MWEFILSFFCAIFGTCDEDGACRTLRYAGVDHIVCSFDVSDVAARVFLRDADGRPFGRLPVLRSELEARNNPPLMLMNGGMYHDDLGPVGLYVEEGSNRKSLSTKDGWGNFHLLPNGVFWVDGDKVGVTETRAYARLGISPDYATQSGPMLVIDGRLHPRFIRDSDSLKVRNGVGVSKNGRKVHFAISRRAINFWDFGKLFQEELDAHNALFLDGTVSAIEAGRFRQSGWKEIGPIIGIFGR